MSLSERIERVRELLKNDALPNEAAVSHSIVDPILHDLGWPLFDPTVVVPQYKTEGRWVDFALLHRGRPVVFIEVKQPGRGIGADRQLFEYAFHAGVPLAVLTDGATWHFYLPAMPGNYDERRVYLLDLQEREPQESSERLSRYLDYSAVTSGDAYESAQQDFKRSRQRREAREAIPAAWQALIHSNDPQLIDALTAEVESASGYKPEYSDVLNFLRSLDAGRERSVVAQVPRRQRKSRKPTPSTKPHSPEATPPSNDLPSVGFMLDGRFHPARNGKEVAVKAVKAISDRHPEALDRMIERPKHGSSRRYLARRPEQLYPRNPDFADHTTTAEVKPGYWLMTHASHRMLERIVAMVCEDAGLRYGRDLRVRMK